MNINKLHKAAAALFAALFIITLAPAAKADSAFEIYRPVMTMTAAKQIPVGSKIAVSCEAGGPVTVFTVDKDRSYLKSFTCPVTKRLYRVTQGGSGHGADQFVYEAKGGYRARLLTVGKS